MNIKKNVIYAAAYTAAVISGTTAIAAATLLVVVHGWLAVPFIPLILFVGFLIMTICIEKASENL